MSIFKKCITCGELFPVKKSHAALRKNCGKECGRKYRSTITSGNRNGNYRGGVSIEKRSGYIYHPAIKRYEHTLIAEKILCRPIKRGEVIHHIDGDGGNNNHNNLVICTQAYHAALHDGRRLRNEKGWFL